MYWSYGGCEFFDDVFFLFQDRYVDDGSTNCRFNKADRAYSTSTVMSSIGAEAFLSCFRKKRCDMALDIIESA